MIKNIIFDAGGVLFTTHPTFVREQFLKKFHFSPFLFSDYPKKISKKYDKKINIGKFSYKEAVFEVGKVKEKDKQVISKYYKKWYVKSQKVDKKVFNLIKKLSKEYNLYCLTNTVDWPLEVNKEIGLFSIFKKVYGSCEMGVRKPDKESFLIPLKELKIKPEETLFIDNTLANINSAKKLKIKTILFEDSKQLIKKLKEMEIIC